MKKIFLTIVVIAICNYLYGQSQVITTGNNVINTSNPLGADVVVGSSGDGGTRHDGSIMWWSNASASRISNTADVFYLSQWVTTNPNVALAATVGASSYFQGNLGIGTTTPNQQFNVNQIAGSAKGLLLSGDEYFVSGNTSTNGILMLLGVNRTGNRQLWIGDNTSLGSPTLGFIRILEGTTIDCVSGDGNNEVPLNLGANNSNVTIDFNAMQPAASRFTINGNLAVGNGYQTNAAPANGAMIQGNVLIGRTTQLNSSYMLDVAGPAHATSIVVNSGGADFVFAPKYKLAPLSFLEKYINQNHHLPEIPSAKQMQANGLDVGKNETKVLQKVEELTLYLIEKDKQINEETKEIKDQKQINKQ